MSRTVRLQLMISCEDLPRVSVMRKLPNAVAVVARLTEFGSVLGIQRHRIGVTEMCVTLHYIALRYVTLLVCYVMPCHDIIM